MKRILICMLILVFVLLIGVAPPLSRPTMRAQAAPETKWVLQETRVPLATFQKDAPQPDGSLFKYTVNASETTLSYRSQSVKEGKVQTDVTYTWTFERPPRELTPGQPVELRIQGKVIGKASSISIIARYSYHADYVENFQEKSGDEVATGRLNSTNLEMSAVLRFTVPPTPPAGRGGQITLVAGTDIVQKVVGTPGQVVWIYRTEAPPPARNEAPPPATVFAGYVLAHDNQNHAFPLPDAPVRIRLELEGNVRVVNTLTNRQGLYQVAVEDVTDKTAYRVQVALAERTGVYQVLWYTDLHPATYVTAEREVGPDRGPDSAKNIVLANLLFEPRMTQGKPVRVEADGSLTDVRQRTVDEDRAAALSYARLYTAMAYGRDRLGVAYDHKLPLAVILGQESSLRSHYDPAGRIEITAEDMNIVFSGEPDNLEWHEFGHFLTQDSAWFGDNLIVLIGADESNHAGVKNRTSQDSVLEGAAEFLVLLFKGVAARTDGQAPYMIGDYLLNLQDNDFDNYDEESKEWVSLEEFHFAALLWDVMDQDRQPEPGDQVAWGLSRLWGVLSNVSSWTVRGHYEALKAEAGEPLPGPQDSPTALDRLFILHGFYSNTNGVAGWQQGEPIGYPDSWKPRAAPSASWGPAQHPAGVRFSPAVPQYLWLEPELPAKVPPPNIAELTVYPTDGRSPWKAPLRAAPDGRFPLLVPPGAERIQLRLLVPGFQVAPLEFTRSNYKAVIEKGTVVVRAKPEVQPSPVGSPGNFNLRREEASTVTLTWSPAKGVDHVVVVRGASHTPASPGDGTVVYEGTGSSVTDDGAILAGTTYYAAFSIGQDGGISVPAIVTSAAPAPQAGSSSSQATKGSSPQTTLPSVPPAGQPRGKAPSSGTSGVNWYLIAGGITFVWLIVLLVRRKLKKG